MTTAKTEIERIASEVSVERLAIGKGVKLTGKGKRVGMCPFHDGSAATLTITPRENTWMCSTCKTGGGPVEWVMKRDGVSKRLAVELLRADHPSATDAGKRHPRQTAPVPKVNTAVKLPPFVQVDVDDSTLMLAVVDFYHRTLKESPVALAYLASRGLTNGEVIENFKLGFADRSLGYRIPRSNRVEGNRLRSRLTKLCIYRESAHEHLAGSIIVPTFDEHGHVVQLYGRKITRRLRAGTPLHLQIGTGTGVWNAEAFKASTAIIVCASYIDALTFWAHGHRNVTVIPVEGLSDADREAFRSHGVTKVCIAYRRDQAGDAAAETVGLELNELGVETFRVQFPSGMDVNDYARATSPAEESLAAALRKAEWMGKGASPPEPSGAVSNVSGAAHEALPGTGTEPAAAHSPMTATDTDEIVFTFGDRRWRVRGLDRNTSHGELRVNLLLSREGGMFFIDTVDMYVAKQRASFTKQAAIEIGATEDMVKRELGHVLLELEARVDEQIRARLAPVEKTPEMTEPEREEALGLLRDPKLAERIVADLDTCGLVGEETNKLLAYIATISRKLEEPLAVLVQSSSAAGKSSLMDAILAMVPAEERVSYSAMTGQALYYLGQRDLRHKVLSVAEGEGAERAAYALKLLQSEGQLTIASTGKDPVTGKLATHEYHVTGPVMTFLTTTAIVLDDELMNRCIVLSVDEGQDQTRRVHARQRTGQTLAGLLARRERDRIVGIHRNAQRLLRPILVVNPFAEGLSFDGTRTRARRDHMKFLTLIRAVALLHQQQRDMKLVEHDGKSIEYIEATAADVELAKRLLANVLDRDEMPPVTGNVLTAITVLVESKATATGTTASEIRFTQRELREHVGVGHTQLKTHLGRLVELEYVRPHRAAGRAHGYVYSLGTYDASRSGSEPRGRGVVGPWSGLGADRESIGHPEGRSAFSVAVGGGPDRVNGGADGKSHRR